MNSDPAENISKASRGLRVAVIGGGAAGFFGALACAEAAPAAQIVILEKSARFLSKVQISGGGRCNVTHACFEPRQLPSNYPRGGRALIGAFHKFQPSDTVEWFKKRGVILKTEADGRMFPVSNSSETIIDCFLKETARNRIQCRTEAGVRSLERTSAGEWRLTLISGETLTCDKVLMATGGSAPEMKLAEQLGIKMQPAVPSLFTFQLDAKWLTSLSGVSVPDAEVFAKSVRHRARGPLLITHAGISGPAVLRFSAWGARELHEANYRFDLSINWLPALTQMEIDRALATQREGTPSRFIVNTPLYGIPLRLWECLATRAGISPSTQWTRLARDERERFAGLLHSTSLPVTGKSMNKDEFVTCGGVLLSEVDFRTMESKRLPGLHFAGEILDIDGITGGFNFQAAWTTGWIAGRAMAGVSSGQ